MAITNIDQLVNAMGNNSSRLIVDKASLANQKAGRHCSLWRATGFPGQGAIPTTPAICNSSTAGAVEFAQQTAPSTSYLGQIALASGNATTTAEIHDRLAANGGLVLNVTTAQTVTGFDLSTMGIDAERIGEDNYSDIMWWLEVYADGGATASNATINVTFNDGSTGNLSVQAVGGTLRAGNMLSLNSLKTAGQQALYIRGINSVTLSASTGTAGNFGFTATRARAFLPLVLANKAENFDWAALGLAKIPNGSCLQVLVLPTTTSSGTLRGGGKIVHG